MLPQNTSQGKISSSNLAPGIYPHFNSRAPLQPRVTAFGGVSAHNLLFPTSSTAPNDSAAFTQQQGFSIHGPQLAPYTDSRPRVSAPEPRDRQRVKREQFNAKPTQLNPEAMIEAILGQSTHNLNTKHNTFAARTNTPVLSAKSVPSMVAIPPQLMTRLLDRASLPAEYMHWLRSCCPGPSQLPNTALVYNLLLSSGLSRDLLGRVWAMVNRTVPGQLTNEEFFAAVALVAEAQRGGALSFVSLCDAKQLPVPKLSQCVSATSGGDKNTVEKPAAKLLVPPRKSHRSSEEFGDFEEFSTDVAGPSEGDTNYAVLRQLTATDENRTPVNGNEPILHLNTSGDRPFVSNDSSFGAEALAVDTPDSGGSSLANSKEPSIHSLDLKSIKTDEQEETKGPSEIAQPAAAFDLQPVNVFDKYAAMKECNGSEFADEHVMVWSRCLEAARSLINDACALFGKASSSDVCRQVFHTEKGTKYLCAMAEVYRVACRIRVSLKTTTFQTEKLVTLLSEINECWETLQNFTAGTDLLPLVKWSDFNSELESRTRGSQTCGVCVLAVGATDGRRLEYANRLYHAQCSNLWVNCIDSLLPALYVPEGLL